MKPLRRSKTLWVNVFFGVIGLLAFFWPGAHAFIKERLETLIMLQTVLNVYLRMITKEAVKLLFLVCLIAGCSSFQPELEPGTFYKRDMYFQVEGLGDFQGVTTLPYAPRYKFVFEPKGDLRYIIMRSCHREESWDPDQKKILGIIPIGDGKFSYEYEPIWKEQNEVCPLRGDSFDEANKQSTWLFVDFEHPLYELDYDLWCNGKRVSVNGVGACQVRSGLMEILVFPEPVRFAPPEPESCPYPELVRDNQYQVEVPLKECLYHFYTADNKMGRVTFIGYQGIKLEGK